MDYKNLSYNEMLEWFSDYKFKTKPYKHQLASISFAICEQKSKLMLLHGIGTGKTLTALYLTDIWNPKGRILIISPNSVIPSWKEEIKKHTDFSYTVLKGSKNDRMKKLVTCKTDIFIINYEGLKTISCDNEKGKNIINPAYPRNYGFEVVIADECHRFKNVKALQTKIAYYFTERARRVILMTGTPIAHSAKDIFGQFYVMDNGAVFGNNEYYFLKHFYNKSKWGYDYIPKGICQICGEMYSGKKEHLKKHNTDIINYRKKFPKEITSENTIMEIVGKHSIRYKREECLDLPNKIFEIKYVDITAKQFSMMDKIISGLNIEELKGKNIEYHLQKILQITSGFLLSDKKNTYEFEINPKLNELKTLIDTVEGKVIIYHQFIHEYILISEMLKKQKINFSALNGKTKDKESEINKFKSTSCNVLLAHPKSGGEGLNLQCAQTIIFFSNGFIGNILREQAEGRIHRAGQTKSCLYIDIVAKDTIDEILFDSLKNKKQYTKTLLTFLKNKKS